MFNLPEYGFHKLVEEIANLNKRAKKLELDPLVLTVISESFSTTPNGESYKKIEFDISGNVPRVAGWTFIGSIEQADQGNIYHTFPGYHLPDEFRNRFVCDHCGTTRQRNLTYVVTNEEGKFMQVGSSCLKDFTRMTNIKQIINFFGEVQALIEDFDNPDREYGSSGGLTYMSTLAYLPYVVECINEYGWVSRGSATVSGKTATADTALSAYYQKDFTPRSESIAEAKLALEWIRNITEEARETNEYLNNLWYACIENMFSVRYSCGLVASLICAYRNYLESLQSQAGILNEYVGTVGTRQVFTLTHVREVTFNSMYGFRVIHLFNDELGHRFSWVSDHTEFTPGQVVTAKGTIKKHREYKGIKQTELGRVKVL